MTTKHFAFYAAVVASAAIAFFAAAPMPPDASTIIHRAKPGESVSLVCIRYYGHYTNTMGTVIQKMNPSIENIDLIFAGQKLTLPNPARPAAAARPRTDTSLAAIFEKKIDATQGVVTCVEENAFITSHDGTPKKKLLVNTLVYPGDTIRTGSPGRVEIIINRESVVRMKENTRLIIEAFRDNISQKGSTQVAFPLGIVWAKIKKFKDAVSRFELELPTAVAGVHGTIYQTSVSMDTSAEIKVFDGEVAVKNRPAATNDSVEGPTEVPGPGEIKGPAEVTLEQWTQIVRAMQELTIDKKGKPSSVQPFTRNDTDTWEQWNEERDKNIEEIFTD
ncbi:MAG: FecR family protein [Chitinispirillaceae bacterium]|jgi:phage tail protein X